MTPSEHLSPDTIVRWKQGELTPMELLALDDHTERCEACRRKLLSAEEMSRAFQGLQSMLAEAAAEPEEHPADEELSAYLSGTLAPIEREVVESHLAWCEECSEGLADLRRFRTFMSSYPPQVHNPEEPAARPRFSFPRWLAVALGIGAAAVVVLLVMLRPVGPVAPRLALRDGGDTVTVDARHQLHGLPTVSPELEAVVNDAVRRQAVPVSPAIDRRRSPQGTEASAFEVHAPRATVVAERQPVWTWKLPPGAKRCRVLLTTPDGKSKLTKPLDKERWQPKQPLQPGQEYHWQVIALDKDNREIARTPTDPNAARFQVLDEKSAAEVTQARQVAGTSHLVMGVLYSRDGLLDDAERELTALADANPGADLPRVLLRSVRSQRGAGQG